MRAAGVGDSGGRPLLLSGPALALGRLEACPTMTSHLVAPFAIVDASVSPLASEMASRVVRSVGRMETIWSRLGRPRERWRSLLLSSEARTMRSGPEEA